MFYSSFRTQLRVTRPNTCIMSAQLQPRCRNERSVTLFSSFPSKFPPEIIIIREKSQPGENDSRQLFAKRVANLSPGFTIRIFRPGGDTSLFKTRGRDIRGTRRDESVCSIVGGVACQTDVEIYLTVAKKEEQRSIDRIRVNQDSAYRTLWLRYSLAADNP